MSKITINIEEARCELAAIFRWSARESLHEGIANHFSYAISDDGQQFLMNPFGVHFSKMKASDLLLLDAGKSPSEYSKKVDPTAWWIHGAMHRNNLGPLYSSFALALRNRPEPLQDNLPPVDQTSCRYFNREQLMLALMAWGWMMRPNGCRKFLAINALL